MKYADYYDCDICNGNSVGMSLFVSGCPFRCKDCFNSEAWDYNYGKDWTPEVETKFLALVGRSYIKRVSFLGGSPLCNNNVAEVLKIVKKIKSQYPDKQIWIYTGYTWEAIRDNKITLGDLDEDIGGLIRNEILKYIDVLVDGPFDNEKKDLTIAFRGSSNQRIIDVPNSLKTGEVVLWRQSI